MPRRASIRRASVRRPMRLKQVSSCRHWFPRRLQSMLVSCAAYQDGRKLGDITVDRIAEYLKLPHTFVWVALKEPEPAELALMQGAFGLHPLAIEDAQIGHQRPKIEEYGDSLFAVLMVQTPENREYFRALFRNLVSAAIA